MSANRVQAADVDATELGELLGELAGFDWIPGVAKLREAMRDMGEAILAGRVSPDASQSLVAVLAGSNGADALTAIGHLTALTTNPDTNPALAQLAPDQAKAARLHGENLVHHLADTAAFAHDHDLHQHAADAAAAIDQQGHRS
ncbi:hypothetical protein [Streptomyces sp. NPDC055105]|uniref:hypothetical protein n=1 Tax=Streptomyces sp. NPDC055105 TaxID=3365719 RepID=UPI0037D17E74